jgi:hypothetical protein
LKVTRLAIEPTRRAKPYLVPHARLAQREDGHLTITAATWAFGDLNEIGDITGILREFLASSFRSSGPAIFRAQQALRVREFCRGKLMIGLVGAFLGWRRAAWKCFAS